MLGSGETQQSFTEFIVNQTLRDTISSSIVLVICLLQTISRLKRNLNFVVRLLLFIHTNLANTKHLGLRTLQVTCFLILARDFDNFFSFCIILTVFA